MRYFASVVRPYGPEVGLDVTTVWNFMVDCICCVTIDGCG